MAGMKRFVTYIYSYEDGRKGSNTGFAKIEIRGDDCRIEIHLRGAYFNRTSCNVCLFREDAGDIQGFAIGDMMVQNGAGDFYTVIREAQIGESPFGMTDMEGIFLLSEDQRILMSRWKEGPALEVRPERFRLWEAGNDRGMQDSTGEHSVKEEIQNDNSSRFEPRWKKQNPKREVSVSTDLPGNETKEKKAAVEDGFGKAEDMAATEIPMRNIFPEYRWEEIWELLQEKYTLLAPFEDENTVCVRIELRDLRELPKRYWYLGNNSFLLHGFFNYRYLVIGRTAEERWFIGVPGIYQNQERVMAAIFGFPEFLPEVQQKSSSARQHPEIEMGRTQEQILLEGEAELINHFGYWYRFIEE